MKPSFEIADHQQGSDRNVPEIKPIDAQDRTIRQDHPANKGKQHIKGLPANQSAEIKPCEVKADQQHKHVRTAPKMPVRVCAGMIGDNARYSEPPQKNFRVKSEEGRGGKEWVST